MPAAAPLQRSAPPQFSSLEQPHVPFEQTPLSQSEPFVHWATPQLPAQMLPEPQSAAELQRLALHFAFVQTPPVPQSEPWPHAAGGAHFAPVQTASGHSPSFEHVERLHFALLQTLPTGQPTSPAQLFAPQVAPVQDLLTVQPLSPAQVAAFPHFEPVHDLLERHALSPAHAAGVLHFAPLHVALFGQPVSPAQAFVEHVAPLQKTGIVLTLTGVVLISV